MKLTYETGIATVIQFAVLSLLNVGTQLNSIVTTCHTHGSNCLTNSLSSIGYFLLIVIWFGLIWVLGYFTQKRRSRRLGLALVTAEFLILVVSISNARHHTDVIGLVTSVADTGFAIWVIALAVRLMRARGGRIVSSERARRRRHADTDPSKL
jgi:hypothetical protein